MRKHRYIWLAAGTLALAAAPLLAQDNIEPPWGAPWGNLYGTSSSPDIPVLFQPGGSWEVAWAVDLWDDGAGINPPGYLTQIVFDAEGNLYWHAQDNATWKDFVASVTPEGQLRWLGPPQGLGDWQSDLSPIVGVERVYMLGMYTNNYEDQHVFALNKANGSQVWDTILDPEPSGNDVDTNNAQPTPALYNGKLYVMGMPSAFGVNLYQIDAATGNIDFYAPIPEIIYRMGGNTLLVPDVFGPGVHGVYVWEWGRPEPGTDFPAQLYGLKVDTVNETAEWVWETDDYFSGVEIGFLHWYCMTHLMYNEVTNRVYIYTGQNSYGYEFFSFDAATGGLPSAFGDADVDGDKSAYQTGALDFDHQRIITGGAPTDVDPWRGIFLTYADDGTGAINYTGAISHYTVWDPFRQFIQLLQDGDHTVAVTATSGLGTGMTHALMIDLDDTTEPPAEDGPTYIDDIEVWQGPNPYSLTLVWSENFEAYDEGELPPESGWVNLYGTPQSAPVVAEDPTGEGHGKVLALDPIRPPGDPDDWYGHGVYRPLTVPTTNDVIVTIYKQWREDTSETYEIWWGADDGDETRGFAYTADRDRRICTLEWLEEWNQPNFQIDRRWEEVKFTYNYPAQTSAVKVADRSQVTSSWINPDTGMPYDFAPTARPAGFGVFMWHTEVSERWSRVRVNHLVDARDTWMGVNLFGGPLVGPDGKMYFFESRVADDCPGCLWAIQAVPGWGLGDMNCDGIVNSYDIDGFICAVSPQCDYESMYPDCDRMLADCNQDGAVNSYDIDGFIALVGGGG